VTDDGTVAADVKELPRVTATPPEGAAAFKVTVPEKLVPPVTLVAPKVTDATAGAVVIASGAENVTFP